MHVCMYVCMRVNVFECICVCMCVNVLNVCESVFMSVNACKYVYVNICECG